MKTTVRATAPAKLILSGEHAVVYGMPALAAATSLTTTVTIMPNSKDATIVFDFPQLNLNSTQSIAELLTRHTAIAMRYQNFLQGASQIAEVISSPIDLVSFAVAQFCSQYEVELPDGLELTFDSSVPLGCGLGSSASLVVALWAALARYFQREINDAQMIFDTTALENLVHGQSSGLDVTLCYFGGCLQVQNKQYSPRAIPDFLPLWLVNTGKPASTTGECVQFVRAGLANNQTQQQAFRAVTLQMIDAITHKNSTAFKAAIMANHRLLQAIGVVPAGIAAFINRLETNHFAGKVCGAGACTGVHAGVVLIASETNPQALCAEFGFTVVPIQLGASGVMVSCDLPIGDRQSYAI